MARPLRLDVLDGIYHVVARGNGRASIYDDDQDRESFLEVLSKTLSRHDWWCLAYCLMGNHFHLVVRTPRANLSKGMQQLNSTYAQRLNRRRKTCGHVFQGRFGASLVERDSYLLEAIRYVVRNPVKAGLCRRVVEWPWSSHRAMIGTAEPGLVCVDEALGHFGACADQARARYREFVELTDDVPHATEPSDVIFGSEDFCDRHLANIERSPEETIRQREARVIPLSEFLNDGGCDHSIALAYRHGYLQAEIAASLGCHYSTVSRRIKAWEESATCTCKI